MYICVYLLLCSVKLRSEGLVEISEFSFVYTNKEENNKCNICFVTTNNNNNVKYIMP